MVGGCAGTMVMMVDAISHTGVTHWLSLPPTARLEEEEEREREKEGGREEEGCLVCARSGASA